MGSLKDLLLGWEADLLAGDERAREPLIEIGAFQGLWGVDDRFDILADYLALGFSIVPQKAGEKKPCVCWKAFQEMSPDVSQIWEWFRQWPTAGPAVVLGPVSQLFVVDVDGQEAHEELLRHLGKVSHAPTTVSGSGKPFRYHLYFRHPHLPTKAKATPWHPNLEFRGQGGIVVMPPSIHKSGRPYRWATCKSLSDLSLPPPPEKIIAELAAANAPRAPQQQVENQNAPLIRVVPGISRGTRAFLAGKFANGPEWNGRLFRAACDLEGCGLRLDRAIPWLLAGARPWDAAEEARAIGTIESAFSQPRQPARRFKHR
jgi:Bifunctional DNA primase/polymerase, N-terminal